MARTASMLMEVTAQGLTESPKDFCKRIGLDYDELMAFLIANERLLSQHRAARAGALGSFFHKGYLLAERPLMQIAQLFPTEEDWDGAPGRLEDIAEILDRHNVPRPKTSRYEAH